MAFSHRRAALLLLFALQCSRSTAQTTRASNVTLNTRACQPPFVTMPFCDTSLSTAERVADLIARIWATPNTTAVIPHMLTARNNGASAIPALGVPEYDWGMNAGHGVQSSCVDDGHGVHCPTSFPLPVNFGSVWNASLVADVGAVIGLETRALWLAGAVEHIPRVHIGLNCWSPNVNLFRDPRWGRAPEVTSEDPLLAGDWGANYARGMQGVGGPGGPLAAVTTIKHWDAYSLEDADGWSRHNFSANVTRYALAGSYFPAFERAIREGGARGVMCSYNAINGVPACASPMLTRVLRDAWGFDGYVTSDSGALEDIYERHKYRPNAQGATAAALRDGQCDVCAGGVYGGSLLPALTAGLVTREDVDGALTRTLRLRFELGYVPVMIAAVFACAWF